MLASSAAASEFHGQGVARGAPVVGGPRLGDVSPSGGAADVIVDTPVPAFVTSSPRLSSAIQAFLADPEVGRQIAHCVPDPVNVELRNDVEEYAAAQVLATMSGGTLTRRNIQEDGMRVDRSTFTNADLVTAIQAARGWFNRRAQEVQTGNLMVTINGNVWHEPEFCGQEIR